MSTSNGRQNGFSGFRRGQSVTVRSLSEILATLDADAKLEGVPFMPEMVPLCGKTFRVHRRAEKTCVEGIGIRSMQNAVFLEGLRCDGSAHDGCQRGCLFFWKEAWLRPADGKAEDTVESGGRRVEGEITQSPNPQSPIPNPSGPSSSVIQDASQLPTKKDDRFYCQSTELAGATGDLPPGKLRHYLHDLRVGEMTWGGSPHRYGGRWPTAPGGCCAAAASTRSAASKRRRLRRN